MTAPGQFIWPSPNGVDHLTIALSGAVPGIATGRCCTCGRGHNIGHAVTVAAYLAGQPGYEPCQVTVTDWPYDCAARDKYPDHTVYQCRPHAVWWHEPS